MNRSLKTVHARVETDRKKTSLEEVREQFDQQIPLGDAAYSIAVERVAHACRERGWV